MNLDGVLAIGTADTGQSPGTWDGQKWARLFVQLPSRQTICLRPRGKPSAPDSGCVPPFIATGLEA
jgi:hypothetical protein